MDVLTISAKENYNKTLEEIKGSNIFELIDLYSNKKNDITDKINNSDYVSEKEKKIYLKKLNIIIRELKHLKVLFLELKKEKKSYLF